MRICVQPRASLVAAISAGASPLFKRISFACMNMCRSASRWLSRARTGRLFRERRFARLARFFYVRYRTLYCGKLNERVAGEQHDTDRRHRRARSMGSAVGKRLTEHNVTVLTSLAGRSEASAKRAREAGMQPVDDRQLVEADFLLSIVPPGDALALAQRPFRRAQRRQQEASLCRMQRGQSADREPDRRSYCRDRLRLRRRRHHRTAAEARHQQYQNLRRRPRRRRRLPNLTTTD